MAIMQHKPNRAEDVIEKLTPMVHKLAHGYARNHRQDFEDLVQLGFEGVAEAYNRFDPNAGSAFSSYAYLWASALMNTDRRKTYKNMNNTGFKPVEDYHFEAYEMPLDDKIDFDRVAENSAPTAKAIISARRAGYNYREISEAMTTLGKPMTLHQVRNTYLKAVEQ